MKVKLDFVEEKHGLATRQKVDYQSRVKMYHNTQVTLRYFQVGDYFLCLRGASKPMEARKLAQN